MSVRVLTECLICLKGPVISNKVWNTGKLANTGLYKRGSKGWEKEVKKEHAKQALQYWSWDGARKCTSNNRLNSFHARELLNQAKHIKLSKSKMGVRSS